MSQITHQVRPFVLLFEGRTGSTYLIEALASNPRIVAVGEDFQTQRKERAQEQIEQMRTFLTASSPANCVARGFKIKLRDVADPIKFGIMLQSLGTHIIYLGRRNRIKQVVSFFNSVRLHESVGDWNLYDGSQRPSAFTIPPTEFRRWLEAVEEGRKSLERFVFGLELPTLLLYYEDLLINTTDSTRLVLNFLGEYGEPSVGRAIKTTSDDLREVCENYDELRAQFVGTPYESMF